MSEEKNEPKEREKKPSEKSIQELIDDASTRKIQESDRKKRSYDRERTYSDD